MAFRALMAVAAKISQITNLPTWAFSQSTARETLSKAFIDSVPCAGGAKGAVRAGCADTRCPADPRHSATRRRAKPRIVRGRRASREAVAGFPSRLRPLPIPGRVARPPGLVVG